MCKKSGGKIGCRKWLLWAITAIFILSGIVCLTGCPEHQYERGPVFDATMKTIAEGGPVKDDLIARGLFTYSGEDEEEVVDVGGVEKLVEAGVYEIDEEGYLAFGPAYSPPTNTP
jgi:hypothetical protein